MKGICFLISVFVLAITFSGARADKMMPIIPEPQQWQWQDGELIIPDQWQLFTDESLKNEALMIVDEFAQLSRVKITQSTGTEIHADTPGIILSLAGQHPEITDFLKANNLQLPADETTIDEAYLLLITPKNIIISAATAKGMFYGIQSLHFILNHYALDGALPAVAIEDWPDLKMRGITDDFSRGQVSTMDNFKQLIRFLSRYKMNVYMPYMEDLFRFKAYPAIGENRGALTAAECIDLQNYAARYHVEIIPIFQTLGHYENILLLPQFRHLAEFPGAASLNVESEEVYDFLEILLAEIVPVFNSVYFHMGADESWDVGKYATKASVERHGLATVHARHYRRVYDLLQKYDKKVMMYGDIILRNPLILNEIPDDLIMFDWHYYPRSNYESTEIFRKAGQPFIVSAGVHNWRKIFPNLPDALANIRQLTLDGYENGAMGSITSNWGDYGAMNLREFNYYPHAYAAECAWSVTKNDPADFEPRFLWAFYGSNDPGMSDVYHLLAEISQDIDWLHMVGHPFYPLDGPEIELIRRAYKFNNYSAQVHRQIKRLATLSRWNAAHLDFMLFAADMFGWYGRLNQVQLALKQLNHFDGDPAKKQSRGRYLAQQMDTLANQVEKLSGTFSSLWLRTNRPDNLQRMTSLYQRLAAYLRIKAEEMQKGQYAFNGRMPAPFITHPQGLEENAALPNLYLRKSITLSGSPEEAWLQLIADSHAKIWINGKEVGQVLARKSLSAWVESARVQSWEVSSFLKSGENIIAVEVHNYTDGVAAANIWLEYGTKKEFAPPVTGDRYWKCSHRSAPDWNQKNFDDKYWLSTVTIDKPFIISRPYFKHSLPSRIEFYR